MYDYTEYIQNTDKEKHNKINEIELSKNQNLFVSQGWKIVQRSKRNHPAKTVNYFRTKFYAFILWNVFIRDDETHSFYRKTRMTSGNVYFLYNMYNYLSGYWARIRPEATFKCSGIRRRVWNRTLSRFLHIFAIAVDWLTFFAKFGSSRTIFHNFRFKIQWLMTISAESSI